MKISKEILKLIKKYDSIVIARHIGADPDALGSQFALKEIIEINFPDKQVYAVGAVSSRFRFMGKLDKIDFVDTKGEFPVYLQAKKTVNIPNYFKIRSECSKNPEDFCIIWNKQEKKNKNFSSVGELVMISKQLFYKLIKLYGARDEESESAGGS